ncbi:hypothetical protein Q1695_010927 [Nippostrongylus brasiliensis]|nr:hypothetical protein Q1695_010927 [Nippostrongylus brasiliensis]
MLLKVALVALVFVAVHGQAIDNPEDRVANKPIVRARRGAAEELIEPLNLVARPLGPTNGRQRRSPGSFDGIDEMFEKIEQGDMETALTYTRAVLKELLRALDKYQIVGK